VYILYGDQRDAIDWDGLFTNLILSELHGQEFPHSAECYELFHKGIYLEASALSNCEYYTVQSSWIRMNSIFSRLLMASRLMFIIRMIGDPSDVHHDDAFLDYRYGYRLYI